MQTSSFKFKQQRGSFLVEIVLGLLLVTAVLTQLFAAQLEDFKNQIVINQGRAMKNIAYGLNDTLGEFYGDWVAATPGGPLTFTLRDGVTQITVANSSRPTLSELRATGYFPPNMPDVAANGGRYILSVKRVPAGCVSPSCNLESLICIDKPIRSNGRNGPIDTPRLGRAAREIGPDAGGSSQENPAVISGLDGKWNVPNDIVSPANQAGILCMRAGYASSAWAAFVHVDGSRWMRNDLNLGGNSLINAKQLVTLLKNIDDPCTDPGAISGGKDKLGGSVAMVCRNNKWKVQTGPTGNPGDPCSPNGSTATSNINDEQLVCKNSVYVRLDNLVGRQIVARIPVVDGQVVVKPTCDFGGVPDYLLVLKGGGIDVTVVPPYQSFNATTTDLGSSWQVLIKQKTDTNVERSGAVQNLGATMTLECKY